MKELTWKGLAVMLLIILGLWMLNSTGVGQFNHPCKTNNDCSASSTREGCILVEGWCGKEQCRIPACLNDKNIDWIRHIGSIS